MRGGSLWNIVWTFPFIASSRNLKFGSIRRNKNKYPFLPHRPSPNHRKPVRTICQTVVSLLRRGFYPFPNKIRLLLRNYVINFDILWHKLLRIIRIFWQKDLKSPNGKKYKFRVRPKQHLRGVFISMIVIEDE